MENTNYPSIPLNELERDPIVHWGCTRGEILYAATKGLMFGLLTGALLILIHWMLSPLGILLVMLGYTHLQLKKLAALRSDKPLFYEVHLMKLKTRAFILIKPNIHNYQRERNL